MLETHQPRFLGRFQAFARLVREFTPYKGALALIFVMGLIISVIQPVCLKLSQSIIDDLGKGANTDFLRKVPWMLMGIFLVSGIAKYMHNTVRRNITERVIIKLRSELLSKYLWFPLSVIDDKRTGDMLASLQNDLQQICAGIDTICDLFKEPFILLGLAFMAFYWDWRLALVVSLSAPLVIFLFSASGSAVKRYSNRSLAQFSDIVSLSTEAITGARVVKVFQLENVLLKKFRELHDGYFKTMWKSIRVQELPTPMVELIGAIIMAGVIAYANYQISHTGMTTGSLVAFIINIGLLQMPIKHLNNTYLKLKIAEAAADRIYGIIDTPSFQPLAKPRRSLGGFRDRVSYENVGLSYGDKRALKNISFDIRLGECVAFVGPSGSGKTSIVKLLPRLYEATEGAIKIDGCDIRELSLEELRAYVSFVTQEVFLFNDTIYENIRYGKPSASHDEILRAVEMAHCTPFVERHPDGLNARIGDLGMCLSGGERQRIAIARAFLKSAPILVLDEATSNLDSESEAIVQEAIDTLRQGKTTFMVAHRFSTVKKADRILVLDHGTIHEQGVHSELLQNKSLYSRLFERQMI